MNRYEKTVAQIEMKGDPIHSYVAVIVPLSKEAHKFFRTDENSEVEEIKRANRKSITRSAQLTIAQIEKVQSLLDMNYDFYYDDPNESEEERKNIVLHEANNRVDRLRLQYWTIRRFTFKKDYDIEVMKMES